MFGIWLIDLVSSLSSAFDHARQQDFPKGQKGASFIDIFIDIGGVGPLNCKGAVAFAKGGQCIQHKYLNKILYKYNNKL